MKQFVFLGIEFIFKNFGSFLQLCDVIFVTVQILGKQRFILSLFHGNRVRNVPKPFSEYFIRRFQSVNHDATLRGLKYAAQICGSQRE